MEDRLQAIEDAINTIQTQINNLASKSDMVASLNIRQEQIENMNAQLISLKTQVQLLQAIAVFDEE